MQWIKGKKENEVAQAPLSMGFSRQEYWSGLPLPSPGDLPGIEPGSPALQAYFTNWATREIRKKKEKGHITKKKNNLDGESGSLVSH